MKRTAGPIEISAEMRRTLRLVRAMREQFETVEEKDLAAYATPRGKPEASLAGLEEIESELGAQIPNDVLAAMMSNIPILEDACGLKLARVLDVAEEADAPKGYIAIGAVYDDPFGEHFDGAHGGEDHSIFIVKGAKPSETRILVDGEGDEMQSFATWVRDQITQYFRRRDDWLGILAQERNVGEEAFVPTLTGNGKREAKKRPARRVKHAKFGAGSVVDETEGKLAIEFDDGVRRVLLEKFVTNA